MALRPWLGFQKDFNDKDQWEHRRSHITEYHIYRADPLEIIQNILQGYQLDLDAELLDHPPEPTYYDWKVSDDCSLLTLGNKQKLYPSRH